MRERTVEPSDELVLYYNPRSRARIVAPTTAGCSLLRDASSPRCSRRPSRAPVDQPGRLGYGTYEDTMAAHERAVTPGPFVLGERFSVADVYVGSQIGFGMLMKSIEPRPAFVAYQARLATRPAFKRFVAQADTIGAELTATES